MKRIAILEDLSEFGRCSMTIALPVLAASGVEGVPIITSLLSSHMGLPGFVCTDLTDTLLPAAQQYRQLQIHFDGIYVGFLSNEAQMDLLPQVKDCISSADTTLLIDPVMGDHGRLYHAVTGRMVEKMRILCAGADIITPNLTEAAYLLDCPPETLQSFDRAAEAARALCRTGAKCVFLTGVTRGTETGVLMARSADSDPIYLTAQAVSGSFHGTGDLFASALFAKLIQGKSPETAAQETVEWVAECVRYTALSETDRRFGTQFEPFLKQLCP